MHPLFAIALALLALVALAVAHTRFWRWYLRPKTGPARVLFVSAADGFPLALGHHPPAGPRRYLEPVVLCHGLGANRYNLDFDDYSVARRLAERGFHAFVLELRGAGRSAAPERQAAPFTFDDYALFDAPAALREACALAAAPRGFWVGHSMGGMIGYVLGQTAAAEQLAGLVAIASPITWPPWPYLKRVARLGLRLAELTWLDRTPIYTAIAPFVGFWYPRGADLIAHPGNIDGAVARRLVAHNTAWILPGVMRQFAGWIEGDRFVSADGARDYRAGLSQFRAPALLVAGSVDRLAPPETVQAALDALGSADKSLILCGRAQGFSTDYGHGDLVFGRRAPHEVVPRLLDWIERRATPVGEGA